MTTASLITTAAAVGLPHLGMWAVLGANGRVCVWLCARSARPTDRPVEARGAEDSGATDRPLGGCARHGSAAR